MKKRLHTSGKGFLVVSAEVEQRSPKRWWLRIWDAWDYLNDHAFGGELVKPSIEVWENIWQQDENRKKYRLEGCYLPGTGTIILWYKGTHVLETLYHEMVHQYMHEVLGGKTGHPPEYWEEYVEGFININKHLRRENADK